MFCVTDLRRKEVICGISGEIDRWVMDKREGNRFLKEEFIPWYRKWEKVFFRPVPEG